MSDALNSRLDQLLEKFHYDRDATVEFIEAHLITESAPFQRELLLDAWKGKIRAYAHGTRNIKEPIRKFKKGKTAGTVIETEASKEAHKRYEKHKTNFPIIYLLYGTSLSIFNATLAEIDIAIARHQTQVDGNMKQIRFLKAIRELLVKKPGHKFVKADWPQIIELARDHEVVR